MPAALAQKLYAVFNKGIDIRFDEQGLFATYDVIPGAGSCRTRPKT